MERNIFIFDQNKCVGCHACVVACMNENAFQTPEQWRTVHQSNKNHFPHLPLFYLSLACNHCEDAPCLKNCPARAYSRDDKTGAIIHDAEKCIGCKYCTWACPFDAPRYNRKLGIIEKCTFCNHRVEENLKPACANLCPVGALDFTNTKFSREESRKSSPVPVDVGSGIKVIKPRNTKGPGMDIGLFENQPEEIQASPKHKKISAREEWPLLLFSLLSVLLVSMYASGLTETYSNTSRLVYMCFVVMAALLSMLHLGKKLRAWRSLINIRNSWLSREIALFALFFAGVFCDFFITNIPNLAVSVSGILFILAIDMLYRLATWQWPLKIHSAQTLFIGMTLFALFVHSNTLFLGIILFRLTLYVYRKYKSDDKYPVLSVLRIGSMGLSLILLFTHALIPFVPAILFAGETIDRMEFYNELQVPEPQNEMQTIFE
ncbi:MAG: hypothetical protein A2X13_09250 [Bacteroidetes bacterium GWC2_33_15]|nr:MAG: hypothetical protein A2X10_01880 [Bacteroidetes bacterium GWA2_33_15]OFX49132.1 MAG: hypothetical protein A2X13_09250 [Bacteroidetes bacterium GWC2_33_15]OFX64900.1 MAG: hypothetical protein A2X15_06125 [Bacteroidetes bacterium GWB2_32_14]OFX68608.1 MAG: hypothetical protein A2X14_14690 [Bacteroidetes bacterium GWD2_33_33]HAN17459.1 hypothetical protein [Bacteroidales bacterium]